MTVNRYERRCLEFWEDVSASLHLGLEKYVECTDVVLNISNLLL